MLNFFEILSFGILLGFSIGWLLSTNSVNKCWIAAIKNSDCYINGDLQKDFFNEFNPKFGFNQVPEKFKFEFDMVAKKGNDRENGMN